MTTWSVSIADTFLNELLNVPKNISKKVSKKIKVLEKDPISARGDAKKIKGENNIYRVRIGNYRLFYSFGRGWVKLLSIRKRDDRTYEIDIPDFNTPKPPPGNTTILEPQQKEKQNTILEPQQEDERNTILEPEQKEGQNTDPSNSNSQLEPEKEGNNLTTELPIKLTSSLLEKWQIPPEYWSDILKITNSEAILDLALPDRYISRILDNCFPRSLEEIERSPEYLLHKPEDLERFVEGDLSAFLLKLDPEQEKLKDFGKQGPILVKGGPGTGKSTLALYRVQKLTELGVKSILFTTYTNALVNYSKQLLEQLLGKSPEDAGVEVNTVDSLIYQYYLKYFPRTGFAKQEDSLECLDAALKTTNIPAKNAFDREVRRATLNKLGLSYLLQEILEVIESRGLQNLEEYLNINRTGRGVPIKAKTREAIWMVYETWSKLMENNGKITWEQLRRKVLQKIALTTDFTPPYQAIIIDEAQDLSPVSLRVLLALVPSFEKVYLTADASQSLYQKGFSWKQVHSSLNVTGRTLILKKNYRNTRQISEACSQILAGSEAGDRDCIDQDPSLHIGDKPILLTGTNRDKEIDSIKDFLLSSAKKYRLPLHGTAVLCPNSNTAKEYAQKLTKAGLKAKFFSGKKIDLKTPQIKVITLHSAKGLEFPFVVIGLSDNVFPKISEELPEEENKILIQAQLRLFYVGCSRAMRALMVSSFNSQTSSFSNNLTPPYWKKNYLIN